MSLAVAGLLASDVDCIGGSICHYRRNRYCMERHQVVGYAPLISDKLTEYNNIYSVNRSDRKGVWPVVMDCDTWHE